MTVAATLTDRNAATAADLFTTGLRMMPRLKTIVIACVDPRVDPTLVLATTPGEVAVIRNVGGRVTPATLRELAMLRSVTQAAGGDFGPGWELVVLQHTDCGITRLESQPATLGPYFGVDEADLHACAVGDPHAAVAHDVATLRAVATPGVAVTGLVYDVTTGLLSPVE